MSDFIFIFIGYLGTFLIALFLVNFFQKGFFIPFFRVKASRGKLVLVKVRSDLEDYFRVGEVNDGILTFKDAKKEERKVAIGKTVFYKTLNVNCVDIDEEANAPVTRDYNIVNGHDAKKFTNLLKRALTKPKEMDNQEKIIMALLFVIVGGVALTAFLVFGITTEIDQCINAASSVGEI